MDHAGGASKGPRAASDRAVRRRRAALAGHLGDDEEARRLVDDPDPGVRATALGALARTGAIRAADLRTALADDAPAVRRRAAELVAELTGDAADHDVPCGDDGLDRHGPHAGLDRVSLLVLLDDADASVVETAAWASGERRPVEAGAVEHLARLATDHGDSLVREAAVAALGAIGDPAGLRAVLTATGDKATVRRRAVLALAPFSGPEVDAALQRALTDRDAQVRQAAEDLTTG